MEDMILLTRYETETIHPTELVHSIVCVSVTRNEAPGDGWPCVSVRAGATCYEAPAPRDPRLHQMMGRRHQGPGDPGSPGARSGAVTSRAQAPVAGIETWPELGI